MSYDEGLYSKVFSVYIYSDLFMYIYDNAIRMDSWFGLTNDFMFQHRESELVAISSQVKLLFSNEL